MNYYYKILVAVLILACAKGALSSDDQNVATFLKAALGRNFTTWITESNLDPTPVVSNQTVDASFSDGRNNIVDATFENIFAARISERFGVVPGDPVVAINESQIIIRCSFRRGYFGGTYKANGTMHDETVSANGNWTLEFHGSGSYGWFDVVVSYENFNVSSDGHIDLRNGNKSTEVTATLIPGLGDLELLISGLSAGGHEREVKQALQEKLWANKEWVNSIERNPMVKYLDEYVTKTLLATPISEM